MLFKLKIFTPKGQRRVINFIGVMFVFMGLLGLIMLTYSSLRYVEILLDDCPQLIYEGEKQRFPVIVEEGEAYVPFQFIKSKLDPHVFWDESGEIVVTTKNKVVKLREESLTAYVNQHPVDLRLPVILSKNEPYIPASTLEILYPVSVTYHQNAGTFVVKLADIPSTVGQVNADTVLRLKPFIFSPRVRKLSKGEIVTIYEDKARWLKVAIDGGFYGYIAKNNVGNVKKVPPMIRKFEDYVPISLKGEKIVLGWEQVITVTPEPLDLGYMPGLNVVSPTWFHLSDVPGELENRADMRYVNWAHSQGYQVWALFSNSFNPEITSVVLRDSGLRDKIVSQLLIYARVYKLDGINIDFENVNLSDGQYFTQFVRELTPMLHKEGLTVSVDITVKSSSPNWSRFIEREKLAQTVDYVMLMAYDQYPQNSQVAGPVSAIPWTEWTINRTLEEVPNKKLVLGIPFYTRLWVESYENDGVKVSSTALGMDKAARWLLEEGISSHYDAETQLFYAEKKGKGKTYKIWLENVESIEKRLELVNDYALAGVAAWCIGFETQDIWEVISQQFDQ